MGVAARTQQRMLVACRGGREGPGGVYSLVPGDNGQPVLGDHVGASDLACVVYHPRLPVAYGLSGQGDGTLHVWSTSVDLELIGSLPSGGREPCHLVVHPDGSAVVVVNYESGTLSIVRMNEDGVPTGPAQSVRVKGDGPVVERQASAHPHQAVLSPGVGHVLVPDLGADLLRTFTLDLTQGLLQPVSVSPLPAGTGPRHAVLTEEGTVVVTGELAQTVAAGRFDHTAGTVSFWHVVASTTRQGSTANHPGDLVALPGGRVVYAANRGADTIAVIRVREHRLELIDEVDAGVRWPQHLALVEEGLLIAGRDSSSVVRHAVDPVSGALGAVETVARLPRPVWLAPAGV